MKASTLSKYNDNRALPVVQALPPYVIELSGTDVINDCMDRIQQQLLTALSAVYVINCLAFMVQSIACKTLPRKKKKRMKKQMSSLREALDKTAGVLEKTVYYTSIRF